MNKTLEHITDIINRYESGEFINMDDLRVLLRELSTSYYHLTKFNIIFAQDHNREVYKFKGSNAAANAFADISVPELRISRKILIATSKVIDSMRSELSIMKAEI